jgi:adenylate kinase family enzyme
MQRIVIIGATGSGKTTFAKKLADALAIPHYPIDDIRFLANWEIRPMDELRADITDLVNQPAWVMDGNYSKLRDLTWGNADTVIWLNYSFPVAFSRLVRRTLRRIITREELFGGCVETFQSQFLSKDSLFLWFFQTFWKHRKLYPQVFQKPEFSHVNFIILKSPRETKKFLSQVSTASSQPMIAA